MKQLSVIVILLLLSVSVRADVLGNALDYVKESEREIFYGWKSHHWISETTNDTHHLVGLRVGHFVAGTFDNSYGRESYFIGGYADKQLGDFEAFGVLGAVRGYTACYGEDDSNTNVCPLLAVGVSYTGINEHFKPTIYQLGDATVIGFRSEF